MIALGVAASLFAALSASETCRERSGAPCNQGGGNPVAKVTGIAARIPGGREVASVSTTLPLETLSMKLSKQTGQRGACFTMPFLHTLRQLHLWGSAGQGAQLLDSEITSEDLRVNCSALPPTNSLSMNRIRPKLRPDSGANLPTLHLPILTVPSIIMDLYRSMACLVYAGPPVRGHRVAGGIACAIQKAISVFSWLSRSVDAYAGQMEKTALPRSGSPCWLRSC